MHNDVEGIRRAQNMLEDARARSDCWIFDLDDELYLWDKDAEDNPVAWPNATMCRAGGGWRSRRARSSLR